jgi:hypothetical protein
VQPLMDASLKQPRNVVLTLKEPPHSFRFNRRAA